MRDSLFPFYTFTRGKAKHIAQVLVEHPGGRLGQTIRATNAPRKEKGAFVPKYVGEGAALQWKPGQFISQFGFMHEAPFELGAFGPTAGKTVERTLQKFGSSLNPLLKTPIELMTGQNLFTGRPIKELYQYPTENRLLNTLIGGSPASRWVHTARRIADPRKSVASKAFGLTTGLNIVDVPPKAREFAAKQAVRDALELSPRTKEYTTPYIPKELQGEVTPMERSLMRMLTTQRLRDAERRKLKEASETSN